ncbi:MAG: hypothetical protein HDS64_08085 [Bacteroidales bacterium]|nr:hypothetical protein [Bacteroidales bacterium]
MIFLFCSCLLSICKDIVGGVISGLIASGIFYLISKYYIEAKQRNVAQKRIHHELWRIKEDLRQIVTLSISPFDISGRDKSKTFVADFMKKDMYDSFLSENKTVFDFITSKQKAIAEVIESLMNSYFQYMTDAQIEYMDTIHSSFFLSNKFIPNDPSIEPQYWDSFGCNQEDMAKSIYSLYNLHFPK